MLREKPGTVVVLSGRNRGKMDRILASVEAGLNVLADKPWLISADDFPKLEKALESAEKKGLVAYDVMTERSEITTILQGSWPATRRWRETSAPAHEAEPAVEMESVHHLMKVVAGSVNLRPAWFFDTEEQGEALGDVATHLVDLVPSSSTPTSRSTTGRRSASSVRRSGPPSSIARSCCGSPARNSSTPSSPRA